MNCCHIPLLSQKVIFLLMPLPKSPYNKQLLALFLAMFAAEIIDYNQTNSFSKIVIDYLQASPQLQNFYAHPPTIEGIKSAIEQKQQQVLNRPALVDALSRQYKDIPASGPVQKNIGALSSNKTFTITTAHQPNLFTGPLYFIYKILHTIKLAEKLSKEIPDMHFVPVFYMGSEDADIEELNHFTVDGKRYVWQTKQKGAVGRMVIDDAMIALIDELKNQLGVSEFGNEWIEMLKQCYRRGSTIQQATFEIVNGLFGKWGLIVLIADDAALKQQMKKVFTDDLFDGLPSQVVTTTNQNFTAHYNVQAHPRAINLFYLKDDVRERIEKIGDRWQVININLSFDETRLRDELEMHPERFSPNVILRGLFQETILPNIVFIGGGGELAYWLQLKDLFTRYGVVFPVLVLRNSFLVVEKKWGNRIAKLGLRVTDFFKTDVELSKLFVATVTTKNLSVDVNCEKMEKVFEALSLQVGEIDKTLIHHVQALQARSLKTFEALEKKMMRAEIRNLRDHIIALNRIKSHLFPGNGLQERAENLGGFYAKWGSGFVDELYEHSLAMEQKFVIVTTSPSP